MVVNLCESRKMAKCTLGGQELKSIPQGEEFVAVTVTYGNRAHLLGRALRSVQEAGAKHVIVVNNGAHYEVGDVLLEFPQGFSTCIDVGYNSGSAGGFYAGIEAALALHPDYVLLLDDDNVVGPNYVKTLLGVLPDEHMKALTALIGYREEHGGRAADLAAKGQYRHLKNSFMSFHLADLRQKISLRLDNIQALPVVGERVTAILTAPYGGLLLPSPLVERIGLPNRAFFLYQDDTEFTLRIERFGGRLLMVRNATVEDIDVSWTQEQRAARTSFSKFIEGKSDFRLFYTMRNHVYIDRFMRMENPGVFALNVFIYVSVLLVLGIAKGRLRRSALLVRAIFCGLTGRLGVVSGLRLP